MDWNSLIVPALHFMFCVNGLLRVLSRRVTGSQKDSCLATCSSQNQCLKSEHWSTETAKANYKWIHIHVWYMNLFMISLTHCKMSLEQWSILKQCCDKRTSKVVKFLFHCKSHEIIIIEDNGDSQESDLSWKKKKVK